MKGQDTVSEHPARELTPQELEAQRSYFELAEKFQGMLAGRVRAMLGEPPYDQRLFDEEQRKRRTDSLMQEAYSEVTGPAAKHELWIEQHKALGWTYGPKFDPAKKEHDNLKPWEELPSTTKFKIELFALVAHFTREAFELGVSAFSGSDAETADSFAADEILQQIEDIAARDETLPNDGSPNAYTDGWNNAIDAVTEALTTPA